eukprot:556878-Rhodomonas_salina.3
MAFSSSPYSSPEREQPRVLVLVVVVVAMPCAVMLSGHHTSARCGVRTPHKAYLRVGSSQNFKCRF